MKRFIFLLSVLVFSYCHTYGQQHKIEGIVTAAEDGLPLVQLTVQIKGTRTGTVTDAKGYYTLAVPSPDAVLVFSYTGYETQEVSVGDKQTINVVMETRREEIDQVVVVGYGSGRKTSSSVGQFTSVASKDLRLRPTSNTMEALAGKIPGLSVLTNGGEPSAVATLKLHGSGSLRGSTMPLYIVDGIPVGNISGLNPSDFERVDVLTDASATSIYGARAANGVISITTKQGRSATKGVITVHYAQGFSNIASTDFYEDILSTPEYYKFYKDLANGNPYIIKEYEDYEKTYGNKTFKWYKYIYNQNAPMRQADVSISGGTGSTSYFISGGYQYQMGLRFNSDNTRYTLRTNISSRVTPWLRVGTNTTLLYVFRHVNSSSPTGAVGLVSHTRPYLTPYDENGNEIQGLIPGANQMSRKYVESVYRQWGANPRLVTSNFISIEPIKNLIWKTQAGLEASYGHSYMRVLPSYPIKEAAGQGTEKMNFRALGTVTNTIEYRFTLRERHHFTPLLGHEYIYGYFKNLSGSVKGLQDDRLLLLSAGTTDIEVGSSLYEYYYNSFFGRMEYDFDSRYFVELSLRNDASSRFSKKARNAVFWAFGLMWKAKNEPFLRNIRWVDHLDVKFSLGTSGNSELSGMDPISANYLYRASIGKTGSYLGKTAYDFSNPGNPDLTWERQKKYTLGINFGAWDRVNTQIAFYRRETSSMLLDVPIPYSIGFASLYKNVGSISNTGVDVRLDVAAWKDQKGNHVRRYMVFNYNRERIDELFDGKKYWVVGGSGVAYAVGHPVELFFPHFKGINSDTGEPEWYLPDENNPTVTQRDPNKVTSTYDPKLAQSLGKPQDAPIKGGFGLNASFLGFYLQADFNFELDKYMLNNDRFYLENPILFSGNNQSRAVIKKKRWKAPGDIADYPKSGITNWTQIDDRLLEDASFLRMKTLTFGYIVPKPWISKTRFFSSAKVYMTLRNYLTFTRFTGPDPELPLSVSLGANPNTKQMVFGIELLF